jgi:hypothetical protein
MARSQTGTRPALRNPRPALCIAAYIRPMVHAGLETDPGLRPAIWGRAPGRRRVALGATAAGYLPRPRAAGAAARG